jgi:archaellum component FlaF (FlaF/FlaG flagellin family)
MRWRYKSSRRGIATIVTSAIMLVAVVIMGSGVVLWGNSSIFSNERTLASSYATNVNKISENLVIEKVWFGTNPQKFVNITLNNQGSIGLNVTQIQLSNSSKTIQYHFGNQIILPQKSGSIQVAYWYNHNVLTNIQITTTRGSTFTTQVLTP